MAFNESMDEFGKNYHREFSMNESTEDIDPSSWGTEEVGTWLGSIGMGEYAAYFAKHQIVGDILHMLNEELLKEVGVACVGHRVKLAKECAALYKSYENRLRFRVHWEADQIMYPSGCCDWFLKQLMCYRCCQDPDHYKLTGAFLYLSTEDRRKRKGNLCEESRETRTIDLSTVAGVSDYHVDNCFDCGCAADVIKVELNAELGLDSVRPILVKKGQGYKISAMITRAVEEAQSRVPPPRSASMAR